MTQLQAMLFATTEQFMKLYAASPFTDRPVPRLLFISNQKHPLLFSGVTKKKPGIGDAEEGNQHLMKAK